jgi:hypothetical protein
MSILHIPMKRIGTTVRLAHGGGFDLSGCPDPEVLAFKIVEAVNAHDKLVAALKRAYAEAVADDLDDWYANIHAVLAKVG